MRTNILAKIATAFAVFAMLTEVNHAFGFKSPDRDSASIDGGVSLDYSGPTNLINLKSVSVYINQTFTGDESQAAIDIVNDLMQSAGSKAVRKRIQRDKLGFKHIRLAQEYKNIPVVGGELIVHINKHNVIYQINGRYLPSINISVQPSVNASDALQIGLDEHEGKIGLRVSKEPSLVIFGTYLAYHYVISFDGPAVGQWWYYVDAHTGKLLQRYNNIKYSGPTPGNGSHTIVEGDRLTGEDGSHVTMTGWKETGGNYYLYNFNNLWGIYDYATSDWEQQATSDWGTADRAATSAGNNLATTQDWVTIILGRYSFDNFGAFAQANIHANNYPGPVNAWWDGTDFHFGDGDNVEAAPLTVLDIVAHEYGHAITDYTSNLIYHDESGALNESFSDIMGVAVEFNTQPDGRGSYPLGSPGQADWLMGEDSWLSPEALRDLRNPQRFEQPSYYHGTFWYEGYADGGGVHINSGVQNFAYYLLAEGGTGTNDGHPYSIAGIGIIAATEVAMRANMVYLSPSSQYPDSRVAWISAAADLGYDTQTVADVWAAVGVIDVEIDGQFTSNAEWSAGIKSTNFDNSGTYYWKELPIWKGSSGYVTFLMHDIWGFTTSEASDYNRFCFNVNGVNLEVWIFENTDNPAATDSGWLAPAGLGVTYTSLDDRGFLVRKNGDPATDRHWLPGDPVNYPQPGDPTWNPNDYYGVFAYAGFNNSGYTTGHRATPTTNNEVYELAYYNTRLDQISTILCQSGVGSCPTPCCPPVGGLSDPKGGLANNCLQSLGGTPQDTLIELSSFTATGYPEGVTLEWVTESEVENAGFNLWRSGAKDGDYVQINDSLITAEGDGTTGHNYIYEDPGVEIGATYYYKLEDIDLHGVSTFHGPVAVKWECLTLISPENGASILRKQLPVFKWKNSGCIATAIEFAADAGFSRKTRFSPIGNAQKWQPKPDQWTKVARTTRKSETVCWRVIGWNASGEVVTSSTFSFTLK
jgi:Zn-dependent metalloprotease